VTEALAIVLAWHEALNAGEVERLLALSSDDVEVGGPRGAGRGSQLLRDWVARANIQLEPGQAFQRGETVVVEERARWRSAESGELSEPQTVASVFLVRDERVASVVRHPDLSAALQAGGLEASDERR
jgi:ketosteroid isomerase-like protein